MKKIFSIIIVGICIIILCTVCANFKNDTIPVEKTIYVPVTDTTCIDSLIYYREQFKRTQDSLAYVKDSLGEDLFVARYKLSRIKYYVDIAPKGNNIKFLRGWCLRVLNE